tara:strand:- start:1994 stop:2629 length:636 start_codon:yes stop_codon:yes gene_type:complete
MLLSVSSCNNDKLTTSLIETTQHQQQILSNPQPSKSSKPVKRIVRGYASPEEAYKMCEQARAQKAWDTVLDCLTQEAQDNALIELHLALAQLLQIRENANQFGPVSSTTEDSKEIALRTLKKKHLAINTSDNNMSSIIPTKYEYFGAIMEFFSTYGQRQEPKSHALIKVLIEGDTAIGTAVTSYEGEKEKSSKIMFKRVNGEWFKDSETTN